MRKKGVGTHTIRTNNPTRFIGPDGMWPECCGANPASLVLGKAQNARNGIIRKATTATSSATAYLNSGSKAISDALTPFDGIAFYSTNNDIKGKGSGMRQSQYHTGLMVEIDPILGPAGGATADPSKALIGGLTALGKIISVIEMMKEALGFGQSLGDAINSALPNKIESTSGAKNSVDERLNPKLAPGEYEKLSTRRTSQTTGWTSTSSSVSSDSSIKVINFLNGAMVIQTDTIKPENK